METFFHLMNLWSMLIPARGGIGETRWTPALWETSYITQFALQPQGPIIFIIISIIQAHLRNIWNIFVAKFCSLEAQAQGHMWLEWGWKPSSKRGRKQCNFRNCATSENQLLDDDVVDMMMWLTWWWECCPWQSSVTRKFSNWTSFENW